MILLTRTGEPRLVDPFPLRSKALTSISSSSFTPSPHSSRSSAIRSEVRGRDEERCVISGIDEDCQVCHLIPHVKGVLVGYSLSNHLISS